MAFLRIFLRKLRIFEDFVAFLRIFLRRERIFWVIFQNF